jgi:hypothetical protein
MHLEQKGLRMRIAWGKWLAIGSLRKASLLRQLKALWFMLKEPAAPQVPKLQAIALLSAGLLVLVHGAVLAAAMSLPGHSLPAWTGVVTHVVDGNTGKQELKNTPEFLDIGLKCTYRLLEKKRIYIESEIGIQNLLNSYQRDFDNGISRDAAYVYGPMRPTTLIFSIKMGSRRP